MTKSDINNIQIRAIRFEDAADLNEMFVLPESRKQLLTLITERITNTEYYIKNLTDSDHVLVAEIPTRLGKKIIGHVGLIIEKLPKMRHRAKISMLLIHPDYMGMGIGKLLMKKILELADDDLMLVRVGLEVFADNEAAIELYKKFDFEIEGKLKFATIKNDRYCDALIMGRYRNLPMIQKASVEALDTKHKKMKVKSKKAA